MARRYKHQSEELTNTLNTERISWQAKFDDLQQGGSKICIDPDERKKLIEQGKQEQKTENESIINELKAKVSIFIQYITYYLKYKLFVLYSNLENQIYQLIIKI